jgi:hypothetical protein
MIGVDWIAGLPTTAGGFDMIQNHVLSGTVHAVPTWATATAADAAEIIRGWMRAMELAVRELLGAAQQERNAKLDAGRVDTAFKVGGRVLLRTKELLDAADIGKLRPRCDGPFTVTACPSPNACTLALPPADAVQPNGQR